MDFVSIVKKNRGNVIASVTLDNDSFKNFISVYTILNILGKR
jgi:hypothetical protein